MARASFRAGRYGQQLRNPLALAARTAALRLTPGSAALRSMTWCTNWRPPQG
ncbi:hypothetical protein ACQPZK_16110 [Micromonospora sp. CA-249363]|uniref:hypothetical protein n=1 Tax=Micromonospora sp. CA-249363 TaxID=3239963 RepID=UPI003D8A2772